MTAGSSCPQSPACWQPICCVGSPADLHRTQRPRLRLELGQHQVQRRQQLVHGAGDQQDAVLALGAARVELAGPRQLRSRAGEWRLGWAGQADELQLARGGCGGPKTCGKALLVLPSRGLAANGHLS